MSIAALFALAKKWKQPKCPSTNEWRSKMWYIHTMKYHLLIIKRNEALIHATTCMHLGNMVK